jgi:valyl-tRNA synthetase
MTTTPEYDWRAAEQKWQAAWKSSKLYAWNEKAARKDTFVIDTPPPYASGTLHMGHIFGFVQADAIARYKRMTGKNVFFTLGFDDNGLPTERAVEKEIGRKASSMQRHEFRDLCMKVIAKIEAGFIESFSRIGLSIDWSQTYRTIDDRSVTISQMSFMDLYEKNLIYRTLQPTIWDTIDQTALAQADLEDKETPGTMYEILFKVSGTEEEILIASTRPELLPACVAVFYHPEDYRYTHLKGKIAVTPICGTHVAMLADEQVKPDKGTGLVMCCTFGDMVDIDWWRKHNLGTRVILDKFGRIALQDKLKDTAFAFQNTKLFEEMVALLEQKKVLEARTIMVELLKREGFLRGITPVNRTVKCAERSKSIVEILVTPQWSVKVLDMKQEILEKAAECSWHPNYMQHRMLNWIAGLNWDWCISRQRYFGVPFPVWYSKRPGEVGKILLPDVTQLPVEPTRDLPPGYKADEVTPERDVMDTWATSALTPQINSKGINNKFSLNPVRHEKLFPADLRFQGHEIIRTWAFYTIAKATMHEQSIPWQNIMINGWVLAPDKTKMSKSKGNIVSPTALLDDRGADVVRYWASSYSPGTDIALFEEAFKNGERLIKKLWFASKFVQLHMKQLNIKQGQLNHVQFNTDKWLISKLHTTVVTATKAMEIFDYLAARNATETFFWHDFCDNYLELIKARIYDDGGTNPAGRASAVHTCALALEIILKLFAPFIPHLTEELYSNLYDSTQSIHAAGTWPSPFTGFEENSKFGDLVVQILAVLRRFKTETKTSLKHTITSVNIQTEDTSGITAESFGNALEDLKQAGRINVLSFDAHIDKTDYMLYPLDDHKLTVCVCRLSP